MLAHTMRVCENDAQTALRSVDEICKGAAALEDDIKSYGHRSSTMCAKGAFVLLAEADFNVEVAKQRGP